MGLTARKPTMAAVEASVELHRIEGSFRSVATTITVTASSNIDPYFPVRKRRRPYSYEEESSAPSGRGESAQKAFKKIRV